MYTSVAGGQKPPLQTGSAGLAAHASWLIFFLLPYYTTPAERCKTFSRRRRGAKGHAASRGVKGASAGRHTARAATSVSPCASSCARPPGESSTSRRTAPFGPRASTSTRQRKRWGSPRRRPAGGGRFSPRRHCCTARGDGEEPATPPPSPAPPRAAPPRSRDRRRRAVPRAALPAAAAAPLSCPSAPLPLILVYTCNLILVYLLRPRLSTALLGSGLPFLSSS